MSHLYALRDCPIRHLGYAVFVDYDPRTALMAMLTGYYDAAGDNADTYAVTVGGYVAPVRNWSRFRRDWRKVLDPAGIGVFHMADFMAGRAGFERWRNQHAKQTALLKKLAKVIVRHTHYSPSSTVLLEDWRSVNKDYLLKECHATPYCLAAFSVIDKSVRWIGNEHPHDALSEFVFEAGDTGFGDLLHFIQWVKECAAQPGSLDAVTPVPKPKSLDPLQAADFASWEQRYVAVQRIEGHDDDFRESFGLLWKVKNDWGLIDKPKLIEHCDWLGVPKRSASVSLSQRERAKWRPDPLKLPPKDRAAAVKARGEGRR